MTAIYAILRHFGTPFPVILRRQGLYVKTCSDVKKILGIGVLLVDKSSYQGIYYPPINANAWIVQ